VRSYLPLLSLAIHSNAITGGGDGGFGEGSAEGPAAEDVPGGDFGDPFEFDQLVFGGLGEFDAV
jgi:hypothetical protein